MRNNKTDTYQVFKQQHVKFLMVCDIVEFHIAKNALTKTHNSYKCLKKMEQDVLHAKIELDHAKANAIDRVATSCKFLVVS